jgi:isopentenyl-diphosphate Delta-isomerase
MSAITTQTQPVTSDNVLRLFPDVRVSPTTSSHVAKTDADLEGYDEEQIRLMEEVCIVLDQNDVPIGTASKKVCQWLQ